MGLILTSAERQSDSDSDHRQSAGAPDQLDPAWRACKPQSCCSRRYGPDAIGRQGHSDEDCSQDKQLDRNVTTVITPASLPSVSARLITKSTLGPGTASRSSDNKPKVKNCALDGILKCSGQSKA